MKLLICLMLAIVLFSSCKEKNTEATASTHDSTTVTQTIPDSVAIRATVVDFYNWYNSNYKKLLGYKLYNSVNKKDGPPYQMNWSEVERYQQFVRDSVPFLGNTFLANQKRFFEKCDSAFKVDVDDDIPYGFDYDWYTNSQEDPSYLVEGITSSSKWIIDVKGEKASVEIGAPESKNYVSGSLLLYVGLAKENGKWTIAEIGND